MIHIFIHRESNNFDDILKDVNLKRKILAVIKFTNHLILDFKEDEGVISYLLLKYGDDIRSTSQIIPDRTPVMYRDYTPIKKCLV
jgi:hypothetical protein